MHPASHVPDPSYTIPGLSSLASRLIRVQGSNQLLHVSNPLLPQPRVHAVENLHGAAGIDEVGRAYLNGSGSDQHEFQGIFGIHDAADTDFRHARADGLPIRLDKITVTPNTKLAHRLIWFAEQQGLSDRTVDELFAGYFVNGENVGDLETLVAIGARAGLDTATVRTFLTSNDGVEQCTRLTEQAYDSGAQGVPAYLWGEQWLFTGAQSPETIAAVLRQQLNL